MVPCCLSASLLKAGCLAVGQYCNGEASRSSLRVPLRAGRARVRTADRQRRRSIVRPSLRFAGRGGGNRPRLLGPLLPSARLVLPRCNRDGEVCRPAEPWSDAAEALQSSGRTDGIFAGVSSPGVRLCGIARVAYAG